MSGKKNQLQMNTGENRLPEGWEWKKLGEILNIARGGSPRPIKSYITDASNGINWIKIGDVKPGTKYIEKTAQKIRPEGIKKSRFVEEGDFLLSNSMSFGRPYILKTSGCIHDGWLVLKKKTNNIDENYLFHVLGSKSVIDQFDSLAAGSTVRNLNTTLVSKVLIPLPSFQEQIRIVAILDEACAAIDKAKANAEKNLANAGELFESYLNGIFAHPGKDWEPKKLGEVCDVIGGGTPSKAIKKYYDGNIHWATVRDMKSDIISDTEHKITIEAVKNSSTNVIPKGNVVIATRVGLGKICLIENDTAINQDLRGVIPRNQKVLSVAFLYRWLKSISKKIIEEGTGATVKGVKLPFIKSLIISIPPTNEQELIVSKFDSLSAEVTDLYEIYQKKYSALEELKKTIFKKAFAGEL